MALTLIAHAQTKSGVYVFSSIDNKVEVFSFGSGLTFDQKNAALYLDLSIFPDVSLTGDYNDLINKPTLLKGEKGDKGDAGAPGPIGPQGPAGATYVPNGASGSFVSQDGKTVTVINGIITEIK